MISNNVNRKKTLLCWAAATLITHLFFALGTCLADAQNQGSIGFGGGGWVPTLFYSHYMAPNAANNRIFLGSDIGGIFYSDDGGASWVHSSGEVWDGTSGVNSLEIDAFAEDPNSASNGIIYAAASGGLQKSTDGGTTWSRVPGIVGVLAPFPYMWSFTTPIGAIAVDPNSVDPSTNMARVIFAGIGQVRYQANSSGMVGIYKSVDGGSTWSRDPIMVNGTPLPAGTVVNRIVFDPNSGACGGRSCVIYLATNKGAYVSQDGGSTWSTFTAFTLPPLVTPPANTAYSVFDLILDPSQKDPNTGLTTTRYAAVEFAAKDNSVNPPVLRTYRKVYASVGSISGSQWTDITRNLPGSGTRFWTLTLDNRNGPSSVRLYAGAVNAYWGAYYLDNPTTTNNSWAGGYTAVSNVNDNLGLLNQPQKISGWTESLAFDPITGNLLYGSPVAVYKSTDSGQSWSETYTTLNGTDYQTTGINITVARTIRPDPGNPSNIFLTNSDVGAMLSKDGGTSWCQLGVKYPSDAPAPLADTSKCSGLGGVGALASSIPNEPYFTIPDPISLGNYYLSGRTTLYQLSGTNTWADLTPAINAALPNPGSPAPPFGCSHLFTDIAFDGTTATESTYLADSGCGGVYVRSAGGSSWTYTAIGSKLTCGTAIVPTNAVTSLTVDPSHNVYAAVRAIAGCSPYITQPGGVYKSADGGQTWQLITPLVTGATGNIPNDVIKVIFDPHDQSLLVGTREQFANGQDYPGGFWKGTQSGGTWTWNLTLNDDNMNPLTMQPDPNWAHIGHGQALAFAPTATKPGRVYGGTNIQAEFVDVNIGTGIWISDDDGQHWTNATQYPGATPGVGDLLKTTGRIMDISVTGDGNNLLIGTNGNGAFKYPVPLGPGFDLTNSGSITVWNGRTTGNSSTITITPTQGFTGIVNLSCAITASPSGAANPTCSIPSSMGISGTQAVTADLTITADSATTLGAYSVTITATANNGSIITSIVVPVTVQVPPSLSLDNHGNLTLQRGETGTATISFVPSGGFTGAVNVACSVTSTITKPNHPPTCSIPSSITIPDTDVATLTVSAGPSTRWGDYTVTVSASDAATGAINSSTVLTVTLLHP